MAGFVDQGLSSFLTIAILMVAGQFLEPAVLGAFVLGVSTVQVVVALIRAYVSETYLVRAAQGLENVSTASRATGLALLLALLGSAVVAAMGSFAGEHAAIFWGTAVALPGVVLQDTLRYTNIANREFVRLLTIDGAHTVLTLGALAAVGLRGGGAPSMLVAWGLVASLGALGASLPPQRRGPRAMGGVRWGREVLHQSSAYTTEAALGAITQYVVVLSLTWFIGPTELAAYRVAMSVFGLTSFVINFTKTSVLRHIDPYSLGRLAYWRKTTVVMSALMVAVVLIAFVAVVVLPTQWGVRLFGPIWPQVAVLALAAATNRLMATLVVVPAVLLRLQGVSWSVARLRMVSGLILMAALPFVAKVAGAQGAFYLDAAVSLGLWITMTWMSHRESRRGVPRLEGSPGNR